MDVPGKGDCWLTSLLAPLLGKIIDVADSEGIIRKVRRSMSDHVRSNPEKYENIFYNGREELEAWAIQVTEWQPEHHHAKWGGDTEYEVFTRITGICVHVLQREDPERKGLQPVTHFLPRLKVGSGSEAEQWNVSCVVIKVFQKVTFIFFNVFTPLRSPRHP